MRTRPRGSCAGRVAAGALLALLLMPATQRLPVHAQLTPEVGVAPALQEDKARLLTLARQRTLDREATVPSAEERLELWKQVLLIDSDDVEARLGYQEAQKDLDAARQRATEEQKTQETAANTKRERLLAAERALYARDLNGAESIIRDVLAQSPDDPRALSLHEAVTQARRAQVARRRTLAILAAVLAVVGVAGAAAVKLMGRKRGKAEGGAAAPAGAPVAGAPLIKVVDGVGRGRIVPVTGDVFRIGAAKGDQPADDNDLIVSDAGSFISRHHCTLVRKGRKYVLVDSSLNGTVLNGRPLQRGEDRAVRDGDEFTLAGVTRLKFFVT